MNDKPVVLIVDDDRNTREGLQRALRRTYHVITAESGERALSVAGETPPDIVLSDVRMPGMDGITLLRRLRGHFPDCLAILLTAYGNVEVAVEAMKAGAYDFLTKPVNLDHLELLIERAIRSRRMESENRALKEQLDDRFGLESMTGNSAPMQQLFESIRQAAPSQATVLIQGESGTGKELVARAMHRLSTRGKGAFVPVHCASLSTQLLESELFGHEKGAFTGAMARRKGRFEMADGGTLFLDEIGEIDAAVQVKLLRVLEERTFERVGGDQSVEVDIRLIAATNRDLRQMVDAGEFREDLYFRLDVITLDLPSLRERSGDIPLLCDRFVREFSERNGKSISGITSDAVNQLMAYPWPGNVRELRNTIEKMVVLTRADRLGVSDVPPKIKSVSTDSRGAEAIVSAVPSSHSLADTEKDMILATLRGHGGNRTKAADTLGISRRTLHRKLNQFKADGEEID
jgi:two-component system response regulator AtoC